VDPQHDLIAEFLHRHPGEVCVYCLADAIDLPPSQVSMAMQRLTFGGAFAARLGICSRCHHRRTVVKAA
jgi:DNA-binding transcriptional ArsR family regulator